MSRTVSDPIQNKFVEFSERRHSLIVPREHGAWGILLVPLLTGASAGLLAGHGGSRLAPLTLAVLSLFWLRTPAESWLGTLPIKARSSEEIELVRNACLILGGISAASLVWLFWGWQNLGLLWIGSAAAVAFIGQAILRKLSRQARTAAQIVGSVGLTAVAAAAYYVTVGELNRTAWWLWALNLLFAADQIEFVQLRIRAARAKTRVEKLSLGRTFLALQFAIAALLIVTWAGHLVRWYVPLAFLPILWRGFAWFAAAFEPLAVHTLGKRELAHAIVFGVLLISFFVLA